MPQLFPGEAGKQRFLSEIRAMLGISPETVINVNFECPVPGTASSSNEELQQPRSPASSALLQQHSSTQGGGGGGTGGGGHLSLRGLETW